MRSNRHLLLHSGFLMAVLGGIGPMIQAATVTTTLPVAATVGAACTVNATGVNFGNFTGAAVNANGSITVTCANGTGYAIALGEGSHPTSGPVRNLSNGTTNLPYRLFQDPLLADEWGTNCAGSDGSYPLANCNFGAGTGVATAWTVYGRLEPALSPSAGVYSDTVLVTVIF